MSVRYAPELLARAAVDITRKNGIENGYLRPLAFFGQGSVALAPKKECPVHVFIAARELGAYLGEEGLRRGVRVTISSWRKLHHTMLPTTAKASGTMRTASSPRTKPSTADSTMRFCSIKTAPWPRQRARMCSSSRARSS
jgi:branched-subunit amino acid aminotransferase/4-amino-4-deoxychorismate lyase